MEFDRQKHTSKVRAEKEPCSSKAEEPCSSGEHIKLTSSQSKGTIVVGPCNKKWVQNERMMRDIIACIVQSRMPKWQGI